MSDALLRLVRVKGTRLGPLVSLRQGYTDDRRGAVALDGLVTYIVVSPAMAKGEPVAMVGVTSRDR